MSGIKTIAFLAAICGLIAGCGANRVQRANDLIQTKAFQEAEALLQEEIKSSPRNAHAYFTYGKCLLEQGNTSQAYDRFRSAARIDGDMKDDIRECLLKKDDSLENLRFIDELLPTFASENADFCYKLYVDMAVDDENCVKFADCFPNDRRAPVALWRQYHYCYGRGDNREARSLCRRIYQNYPKTFEGGAARSCLDDWWNRSVQPLKGDTDWHGFLVRKGQGYRYQIKNGFDVTFYGGAARETIDGDRVKMFIGTREDLHRAAWTNYGGMLEGGKWAGTLGRGVAPKNGCIWFKIDTEIELTRDLELVLDMQEKTPMGQGL